MWELPTEIIEHLWSSGTLPSITSQWFLLILVVLVTIHILTKYILYQYFKIEHLRFDSTISTIQYSPFYHLAIIILVLSEVDWNIFDLGVWMFTYIGIGIVRKGISTIKHERQILLNNYNYDSKLIKILYNSKMLGLILFFTAFMVFLSVHFVFLGVNIKILNLLVFPFMMLTVDGIFLFVVSAACQKDILIYFNHNINEVLPTYKLELIDKITCSSIRVWHYYNLIRFFLKTLVQRMGVLEYMWIFSIVNSLLSATKTLYTSTGKYRNYNKLMARFDRLFKKSTSAPEQNCPICLTELLNCKQLSSCGHKFHYRCLLQWMQTKLHCPICRGPIEL